MRPAAVGNTVLKVTVVKQALSRREMVASFAALSYVTSAIFLPKESPVVLAYSLAGLTIGAVWGYARRVFSLGLLVRCVALLLGAWVCVAIATQDGMRYLVIPTEVFPNRLARAILSLYDTARVAGDVVSTPSVLAVALGFATVVGALAVGDALKGAVFRVLTVVLLPTAFLVYRSEMSNAWCAVVMTSSAVLLLSSTGKHGVQIKNQRINQRITEAVRFLSVVAVLVFLAAGPVADALQRGVVERLHSVVVPPADKIKKTEYMRFDNAEQAAGWVARNVSLTEQLAGDVNAVLEQQRGNAAQLASVAAALTNAGGVRIDTMQDGTVRLKIPTGMPPMTPAAGGLATTTPAPAGETPASTALAPASPDANSTGLPTPPPEGAAAATTYPASSATAPTTSSGTLAPAVEDKPGRDVVTLLAAVTLLLLSTATWFALRRKRRTAEIGVESEALRSWRRVEKKLEKTLRSAHEETMTYRERHTQVGSSLQGAAIQHRMLAEAVDAAAYGPPQNTEKHGETSAELAAQILENMKEKSRG